MILRALLVWFLLLLVAILNGGFREAVLVPRLGSATAHVMSAALLSAAVLVVAWLTVPWIGPQHPSEAWRVGLLWVVLTLAFEFLAGHYLFGQSWSQLLADYNVAAGRIWPLVLLVIALSPWLVFRFSSLR